MDFVGGFNRKSLSVPLSG